MRQRVIETQVLEHPMTASRVLEVLARCVARSVAADPEADTPERAALVAYLLLRRDEERRAQISAEWARQSLDVLIPTPPAPAHTSLGAQVAAMALAVERAP